MREKISAGIAAGNEEDNIRRCLESVKWADEIVVVDSFSTDKTVEICKEYTDRITRHKWLGYVGQRNLVKDRTTGPWVLLIDADEEVSIELKDEILRELENPLCADCSGYELSRMSRYFGRWIRHGEWYPDFKLRLFRKEHGRCGGKEPHDKITVDGRVKRLKNHLYHYTYRDISEQITTMNKFTTIAARGRHEDGKICHLWDLLLRPLIRFVRGYFLKRGFMDGLPGLIIAVNAFYGTFVKYAKLWEIRHCSQPVPTDHCPGQQKKGKG